MLSDYHVSAIILALATFGFACLKLLPRAISKLVDKEIERRSDIKLEKLKAEIQGSYSTLKTSVDMLTVSNSGLHPHIIETVTELWGLIVSLKGSFSGLIAFDAVFLANEASEAFENQAKYASRILLVAKHQNEFGDLAANGALLEQNLDKHRLFCGDRLWLNFFVIRAVYLRSSLLIARSFQKATYVDWRTDDVIRQHLSAVLPDLLVAELRARSAGGLQVAIDQLEARFLHEATRVMSGSKAMADSLADVQSVLLIEHLKIAGK